MCWLFFYIFLIIETIIYLPQMGGGDAFWRIKEGIFLVGAMLFLALSHIDYKKDILHKRVYSNLILSILLVYVVISFAIRFVIPSVFNDINGNITWHIWTLYPSLHAILGILLVYSMIEQTDTMDRWISIGKVICWLSFITAIYGIFQYCGIELLADKVDLLNQPYTKEIQRTFTFFGNKMLTSNFLAITLPLFLIFKKRGYYLMMATSAVCLILIKSGWNIACAVLGVVVFLVLCKENKKAVGVFILGIILLILTAKLTNLHFILSNGLHGRWGMWINGITAWKEQPLFGYGLGGIIRKYTAHQLTSRFHSFHNFFVDILYDGGLVGIVLVCGYLINLFMRIWLCWAERKSVMFAGFIAGLLTWLLVSLSSFPHTVAPLALLLIVFIAGIEVSICRKIYKLQ